MMLLYFEYCFVISSYLSIHTVYGLIEILSCEPLVADGPVCPAAVLKSVDYGEFLFPETVATKEGVHTRAPCPYGIVNNGLEPMFPTVPAEVEIAESQSGATRFCRLNKSQNDSEHAMWECDSSSPDQLYHCRFEYIERGVRKMRSNIDEFRITPHNFKTIIADFRALLFSAARGDYKAAKTLIEAISNLLASYSLYEGDVDSSAAQTAFNMLDEFTKEVPLIPGFRLTVDSPHITVQTAQFPYRNTDDVPMNYSATIDDVELKFPSEIIKMSINQNLTDPKLRVITYSETLFIHWKEEIEATTGALSASSTMSALSDTDTVTDGTDASSTSGYTSPQPATPIKTTVAPIMIPDNDTGFAGHWRVFAIDILNATIKDLDAEFEYTFHPENVSEMRNNVWTCVFWDESENVWSSKGMRSVVNNDTITCLSTHFTAFSVLIDPLPLPIPGSDYAPIQTSVHSDVLSILSSIGSAISIVGLAGVILTYGLFRCLRRERSNRILLNLSLALFMMHLISISSSKAFWDGHCLVPSMLLQYFLHSSLFWMLMEAHHMYQLLISVFVKPETRFLAKRCLLAWGIPLVIVSVCASVRPEVYYTGRHDVCVIAAHLNLPLYYIAYMGPVFIILFVNLCVFCRIFNVLYKQTVKQKKQGGQKKAEMGYGIKPQAPTDLNRKVVENLRKTKYVMLSPTQIKGAVTVMVLVGAGWVVGLFAIGPFEVFFKYLFCITNAGQGALIFLFRVVLHPQACREWRKAVLGWQTDSSEASTTSTTNVNTTHRKSKGCVSISPAFISTSNSVENSLTASNPDAKDLARTLASMLQSSQEPKDPQHNNRF